MNSTRPSTRPVPWYSLPVALMVLTACTAVKTGPRGDAGDRASADALADGSALDAAPASDMWQPAMADIGRASTPTDAARPEPVGLGEPCDGFTPCDRQLRCAPGGYCLRLAGAPCRVDGECADGVCAPRTAGSSVGVCGGPVGRGAPCIPGGGQCAEGVCALGWLCPVGPGGACATEEDCLTGRCLPRPEGGVCGAPAEAGEACDQGSDCVEDRCLHGRCRRPLGSVCATDDECDTGAVACRPDPDGGLRCLPPHERPGQPCRLDVDCAQDLICDVGACRGADGWICEVERDCAEALTCVGDRCRSAVELASCADPQGAPSPARCAPHLICNTRTLRCQRPRAGGWHDPCGVDVECGQPPDAPVALVCHPRLGACVLPGPVIAWHRAVEVSLTADERGRRFDDEPACVALPVDEDLPPGYETIVYADRATVRQPTYAPWPAAALIVDDARACIHMHAPEAPDERSADSAPPSARWRINRLAFNPSLMQVDRYPIRQGVPPAGMPAPDGSPLLTDAVTLRTPPIDLDTWVGVCAVEQRAFVASTGRPYARHGCAGVVRVERDRTHPDGVRLSGEVVFAHRVDGRGAGGVSAPRGLVFRWRRGLGSLVHRQFLALSEAGSAARHSVALAPDRAALVMFENRGWDLAASADTDWLAHYRACGGLGAGFGQCLIPEGGRVGLDRDLRLLDGPDHPAARTCAALVDGPEAGFDACGTPDAITRWAAEGLSEMLFGPRRPACGERCMRPTDLLSDIELEPEAPEDADDEWFHHFECDMRTTGGDAEAMVWSVFVAVQFEGDAPDEPIDDMEQDR